MPSLNADPRDYVAVKQIPAPSHVGLKITARTSSPVYTCEKPSRKEVAKTNFERRTFQTTQCGYRSVNYKPYKSVGEVLLDDKELILKALGQLDGENEEENEDDASDGSSTEMDKTSQNHDFLTEEENVVLPVPQLKTDNLQTLQGKLNNGRAVMNKVRLGIGLFKLIQEEHCKKVLQAEKERVEEEERARSCMRPANENQFNDSDDENVDLSRYMAPSPTRSVFIEDSNNEDEIFHFDEQEEKSQEFWTTNDLGTDLREERASSNGSDVSRHMAIKRWQRLGSMASQMSIEKFQRSRGRKGHKELQEYENDEELRPDSRSMQAQERISKADISDCDNQVMKNRKEESSTVKNKLSKNKKYKNDLPRPFSPVFTNINFYETESREYTFRQLCVIHWILEAMSQDQQPVMPPISTCWKLKDLKEDLRSAQRKVEREKAVDPVWKSFLTNPNKFSRVRTGRKGTLLQRRVSVAPSVLRLLSASSCATSSTHPGLRPPSSNYSGDSLSARDRLEGRSRSSTPTVSFIKEADEMQDGDLTARKLPSPRTANAALRNWKEKAYTVRDVVVANNAFNRRGSKMVKSYSALASNQRRRSSVKPNMLSQENRNADNAESGDEDIHKIAWTQKNGGNTKARFVAAAIATYGAISINKKAENIPAQSREKFEELSKENALVLHDNLEMRERTNVESMEKKFFALNVMSDVHKAINVMRSKSALRAETEEEKKARFSEECSWYKSLLDNLPSNIRTDRNNALVLDKIAKYGSLEGRKISSAQFMRVLSLLRSWELCYPDISAGIEFVRDKVVKMDKREFEDWFQSRISKHRK